MVSEIMALKEVEISIIGQYGLQVHPLNLMEEPLDHSTASSELKLYQFGKQFAKQLMKKTEHTTQVFFYHTKNTTVNLEC